MSSPEPIEYGLTVAAVARRIGVAPATLRTWERRYGLGPSTRSEGQHRRYNSHDIARLELMRRYLLNGVGPQEAARLALAEEVESATLIPQPAQLRSVKSIENEEGKVIELGGAKATIKALQRAANMLDSIECERIIGHAIEEHSALWVWENVLVPLLVGIGEKWETTGEGVEVEHLLSEAIINQFRVVTTAANEFVNAKPVLLVGAPNELHVLALHAIAATLAEHHISSRMLGARLPLDALAAACKRIGPSAVVIWSQTRGTADFDVWEVLSDARPRPIAVAAGFGWSSDELADGVVHSTSLMHTLMTLSHAAGSK